MLVWSNLKVIVTTVISAQFLHGGMFLHQHQIHHGMTTVSTHWYKNFNDKSMISTDQVEEMRKIGKKTSKTVFWCFQLTWYDHTTCFLKIFTLHVKDKVIFPPCLWNQGSKSKRLTETSSFWNAVLVAMQTRQIHQKTCMGLPLLIFCDIFLFRSVTLTDANHIFLPLVCHRHITSTCVVLCAFSQQCLRCRVKVLQILFQSFIFFLSEIIDCCGKPHTLRQF